MPRKRQLIKKSKTAKGRLHKQGEKYNGNRHLNNLEIYKHLTPKSKRCVEAMLHKVVENWVLNERATTLAEIRAIAKTSALCYPTEIKKQYPHLKNIYPETFLREILPYLPVSAGRYFVKKRGHWKKPNIIDQTMHKNIQNAFPLTKGRYSKKDTAVSTPQVTELLNKSEHACKLEVLFFPSSTARKVSTTGFLKKLGKINDNRLKEWGLIPSKKNQKAVKHISKWEISKVIKVIKKADVKTI
ncbi:hypothetical protein K8R43_05905 [archaeon]|nr:hypothetical protein [archaeon]